ncbi:MAG TPA: hypothetical protein VK145_02375 [Candidatus Nanoarchaeia archaeon]|nr:hypothetical protein [Candidatus Nanoarchaeia archaeon]
MNNSNKNMVITGVIALVVGLLLGWMIGQGSAGKTAMTGDKSGANKSDSTMMEDDNAMMEDDSVMLSDDAMSVSSDSAILVGDQGAGDVVTVASVETDAVAWVAIRDNNNGVMGNILGAARIDAGASNNIVVSLLRSTMPNKSYFVTLYADNGDRMFDHKSDMIMVADGAPISQIFNTVAQ